jgi:hypothetical protein
LSVVASRVSVALTSSGVTPTTGDMQVDGEPAARASTKRAHGAAAYDLTSDDDDDESQRADDMALDGMAAALAAGGDEAARSSDDESESDHVTSSGGIAMYGGADMSSSDDESDYDGAAGGSGSTPPRGGARSSSAAPSLPRKTKPELPVPSLDDLLKEKQAADLRKQRRRKAVEREEAEYAARLAETQRLCEGIMATVTSLDDTLPAQFRQDAGAFVDLAAEEDEEEDEDDA